VATIREETERYQDLFFSPYAMRVTDTKGRMRPEEPDEYRTAYQRDRDRIVHCNAFRRLQHKTQVFLAPMGDHYRTRLTHTLEVAQIARSLARGLKLNEDLTEAIALGHDLGHTPFGHAGERALREVHPGGFRHYEQSLRVVDVLEKEGKGLNLTYEVRNGILCHTEGKEADTLEGRIVKISDHIAFLNHDIDDAIHAGLFTETDLPGSIRNTLGKSKGQRIDTMVRSVIQNTDRNVHMDPVVERAYHELKDWLFENVYTNPVCKGEEGKAQAVVQKMYLYFEQRPEALPEEYQRIVEREGASRAACDYISGMSDRFALYVYESLFVPKPWAEV